MKPIEPCGTQNPFRASTNMLNIKKWTQEEKFRELFLVKKLMVAFHNESSSFSSILWTVILQNRIFEELSITELNSVCGGVN